MAKFNLLFLTIASLLVAFVKLELSSIVIGNTFNDILPPSTGKFFYLDFQPDQLRGYYFATFWKTDGTDVFRLDLSTGSFFSSIYNRDCYTCNAPNKYWVGTSGIFKTQTLLVYINKKFDAANKRLQDIGG